MLSLEQSKQLIDNPNLSDQEIEQIRDEFKRLAEIIFEKWQEDNKKKQLTAN